MSLTEAPVQRNQLTTGWTPDRIADLTRFWSVEGMTASEIAYKLGGFDHCIDGGRSAIIGKVHRLQLETRAARIRPVRPQTKHIAKALLKRADPRFVEEVTEPAPEILADAPCSLLDLDDTRCRFPIGHPHDADFHFCGGTPSNGPYCAGHHRIAYQPPRARP